MNPFKIWHNQHPAHHVVRASQFFAAAALVVFGAQAAPAVTAATEPQNFKIINKWFAEAKGCQNIRSFDRGDANRGVVEAVLTCQALKLGGYDGEFKLVMAPNFTRAMLMAIGGEVTMPAESLWAEDVDEKKFYSVAPILVDGDNLRALFVSADKVASYSVKTVEDLRKLTAAMQRNWVKDWAALAQMGIKAHDAGSAEALLRMVAAGHADFTLFGFNSNPNFELESEGNKFLPLPGVKIAIHGERRLSVNKTAPEALAVFNALNKGIGILRANGTIARAWRESGFINKRVDSWTLLN